MTLTDRKIILPPRILGADIAEFKHKHLRNPRDLREIKLSVFMHEPDSANKKSMIKRKIPITETLLLIGMILLIQVNIVAQNTAASDSAYYDFWIGDWHQIVDGKIMDEPRFKIKRGLYRNHLEEEWQMEGYKAKAWRGWDSTAERWIFTWVSELGHYQVWEEKKVGDHWYMFKTFNIDGEEVLSRQAFIPQSNRTVIRTSEHSRDGGESWTLRFREEYTKKEGNSSNE